jgi:LacI family transcriptional regulator
MDCAYGHRKATGGITMAATMKDIATLTGLGIATISKYLNGGQVLPDNKKLIDDAIRDLHFIRNEFARGLKTNQSRTIGVVIPELNNAFITSIISTMEDILRRQNYAVIVCDCRSNAVREREAVSFLVNKRVDGLINMPTDPSGSHLTPALAMGIPVVLVDRMLKTLMGKVSAVIVDNANAAEKATRYLLDFGHTSVAIILGNELIYTTQKRREGYLAALNECGILPREELVIYSDYTMEGGYNAMKKLLSLNTYPSAVFVTNHEMTLGAIIALNEAQLKIPSDISFIGFDKLDLFGAIYPNLTLVKQPQNAISQCVGKQLLTLLSNDKSPKQMIVLTAQLHEGSSVKNIIP